MTSEKLSELESLKHPVTKEASEFIKNILESPYYESYVALSVLIGRLNDDLKTGEITIFNQKTTDRNGNTIVDNTFPNAHKYATEMESYHSQLEYLRGKMLPEQMIEAKKEISSTMDEARDRVKKRQAVEV